MEEVRNGGPAREPLSRPVCICVAGAGGKTSLIHYLAAREAEKGHKVLLVTTTHILGQGGAVSARPAPPAGEGARLWAEEIGAALQRHGVVTAGVLAREGKLTWMGEETYGLVREKTDWILAEADGSRHLPAKAPADGEPVILPDTDAILVTQGMEAAGHPIGEVCHRAAQVCRLLGCGEDTVLTRQQIGILYREGYEKKLKVAFPGIPVIPVWVYREPGTWESVREQREPEFIGDEQGQLREIHWRLRGIFRLPGDFVSPLAP